MAQVVVAFRPWSRGHGERHIILPQPRLLVLLAAFLLGFCFLPTTVFLWLVVGVAIGGTWFMLLLFAFRDTSLVLIVTIIALILSASLVKFSIGGRAFSPTMPFSVLLICIFLLPLLLHHRKAKLPLFRIVTLYFLAMVVSLLQSRFMQVSLLGIAYQGFFLLLFYTAFNVLRTKRQVMVVYYALALLAVIVGLIIVVQFARTGEFATALARSLIFGNRLVVTSYLIISLPLLAALASSSKNRLLWALSILGVVACFLLGSRAGVIVLTIGLWLVFSRVRYGVLAVTTGILAIFLFMQGLGDLYSHGFRVVLDSAYLSTSLQTAEHAEEMSAARSTLNRWAVLTAGINMFLDSPLIGWGFNTGFHMTAFYNFPEGVPVAVDISEYEFHNTYLRALAETGIIGLIALLAFQIGILSSLLRALKRLPPGPDKVLVRGLFGGVVALFVYYLMLNGMNTTMDFLYLGFALAAARVLCASQTAEQR